MNVEDRISRMIDSKKVVHIDNRTIHEVHGVEALSDDIVFVKVDPETRQPTAHGKTIEGLKAQTDDEVRKLNMNIDGDL